MMIKWKAGRGGTLCACASLPLTTSSSITPIVMYSGQVARPDGRRFGPSERGAADHWWSYRPFLRHRLDDRSCPSTTSCAAPARKHIMLILLLNIRLTAPLQTIASESTFFLFFIHFSHVFKFKISCRLQINKKKKNVNFCFTRARVVIVYCRACVASSPSHGFHSIFFLRFKNFSTHFNYNIIIIFPKTNNVIFFSNFSAKFEQNTAWSDRLRPILKLQKRA